MKKFTTKITSALLLSLIIGSHLIAPIASAQSAASWFYNGTQFQPVIPTAGLKVQGLSSGGVANTIITVDTNGVFSTTTQSLGGGGGSTDGIFVIGTPPNYIYNATTTDTIALGSSSLFDANLTLQVTGSTRLDGNASTTGYFAIGTGAPVPVLGAGDLWVAGDATTTGYIATGVGSKFGDLTNNYTTNLSTLNLGAYGTYPYIQFNSTGQALGDNLGAIQRSLIIHELGSANVNPSLTFTAADFASTANNGYLAFNTTTQQFSLSNTLNVTGTVAATVNLTGAGLAISNDATITDRLVVGGTPTNDFAKLWSGGDVYVSGNSTTTGTTYLGNNLTINGNLYFNTPASQSLIVGAAGTNAPVFLYGPNTNIGMFFDSAVDNAFEFTDTGGSTVFQIKALSGNTLSSGVLDINGTGHNDFEGYLTLAAPNTGMSAGDLKVGNNATTTNHFEADSILYVKDSKVGVGTSTPFSLFEVGNLGANTYFSVDSSGNATSTKLNIVNKLFLTDDNYFSDPLGSSHIVLADNSGANSDFSFVVAGGGAGVFAGFSSAGTLSSPTISSNGSANFTISGFSYDGNSYESTSKIELGLDGSGAASAGDGDVPGDITFSVTPDGSTTPATAMILDYTKQLSVASSILAGSVSYTAVATSTLAIAGDANIWTNLRVGGNSTTTGDFTVTGNSYFDASTVKMHTYPAFTYPTTTPWTGTTTIPLGPAYVNEQWTGVKCFTDAGSLNVIFHDGTNQMNIAVISTTVGSGTTLSTNNTFTAGEKRYVSIGGPVSSPTSISCSVDKIINN